jgi:hypothetical protein
MTPTTVENEVELAEQLYRVAMHNIDTLEKLPKKKHHAYVRNSMKHAEVVYAIWWVGTKMCCYCIKGIGWPDDTEAVTTAFFVHGWEDAEGMRKDWGDRPPISSTLN